MLYSKSMTAKRLGFGLILALLTLGAIFIFNPKKPLCANSLSCGQEARLQVDNGVKGVFNGRAVMPPAIDLAAEIAQTRVLGETEPTGPKHIYVDLTTQTLTAYQGDALFMQVPVSTGKWAPTPAGEFTIWSKFRSTKMSGGSGNDYYYLPNVPYVMFYSGSGVPAASGFSLHGAYWHNNFGHPMSHGCVNMREVDAGQLFYWAEINDPITVYGQAPL